MPSFPKRFLPSVLTLVVGIGIGALSHRLWVRTQSGNSMLARSATPLTVNSVPDADFTEAAKQSPGISASVRLQALVDANGQVIDIRPYPMLPYDVPESAAGSGAFADVTPAMVNATFVEELPYGMTDAAIQQARGIQFIPRKVNGKAVPEKVNVITNFGFDGMRWPTGCDSIKVTVFDSSGTLWQGQTSVHRYRGCFLH